MNIPDSKKTNKIVVAIDGYSSSGKSTMARWLAAETGYRYIDSGAMYRAVTLAALRKHLAGPDLDTINVAAVAEMAKNIDIDFRVTPQGQVTLLDGENVEPLIRGMEVADYVSEIAAIPQVREALTAMQRKLGANGGIVMDGRDIGTTVFPEAALKVFVNASAETRARRRCEELRAKGEEVDFNDVLDNIEKRDRIDETRTVSPLRRADDAVLLDNSTMSREEQNRCLLDLFNSRIKS